MHSHLMEGRAAPYYGSCIVPLTVEHLLVQCPDYRNERLCYFGTANFALLELIGEKPYEKIEINHLFEYLTIINLIDKI